MEDEEESKEEVPQQTTKLMDYVNEMKEKNYNQREEPPSEGEDSDEQNIFAGYESVKKSDLLIGENMF